MNHRPPAESSDAISLLIEQRRLLWALAIVFFGFGDLLTTLTGLHTGWAVETGPFAAFVVSEYGMGLLVPLKVGTLGLFFGLWHAVPAPYRIGVPLGLVGLGFNVTLFNLYVLLT